MLEKRMKRNGFSLVELLVVIGIMATLMTIAGISYNSWMQRYRLEGQVRELYVDLMNARVLAMQKNIVHGITIEANAYKLVEDTDNSGTITSTDAVRRTKSLAYSSDWSNNTATLDTRGLVSPSVTIRFATAGVDAAYDCIVLIPTRIRMGKYNGTECIAR